MIGPLELLLLGALILFLVFTGRVPQAIALVRQKFGAEATRRIKVELGLETPDAEAQAVDPVGQPAKSPRPPTGPGSQVP